MQFFTRPNRREAITAACLGLFAAAAPPVMAQGMGGGLSGGADDAARWEAEMRTEIQTMVAGGQLSTDSLLASADLRELLDAPRSAFAKGDDITGQWRVRSLQVGPYGIYAYPYFGAVITPGTHYLGFDKNTGSQRRAGSLRLDEQGRYAFLGSYYSEGEAMGVHSSLKMNPTDEDRRRDSEGILLRLGPDHALLLFASKFFEGTSYRGEVYEMRR